jgi:hypothetical protein
MDYYITKDKKIIKVSEKYLNTENVQAQGKNPTFTKINYFKGKNPHIWKTNLPTYKEILYKNIYPGINLTLRAYNNNIEKIYTIESNGDPNSILTQFEGANSLKINKKGELEILNNARSLKLTKPVAYQIIKGKKVQIPVNFIISGTNYGYKTGAYNKNYKLYIDPLLASTFLGGSSYDNGQGITIDKSGNIYVTGYTGSSNFPSKNAYQGSLNGGEWDAFIAKFDKNLKTLISCTYLGGGDSDQAYSISIDQMGYVFITGITYSPQSTPNGFPIIGAYDSSYNGAGDIFISKLSPNLDKLLASTYFGGSKLDKAKAIIVDRSNNVYITGQTFSSTFPVVETAFQDSYNLNGDAYVSKFNNNLKLLTASTFLGGSDEDFANALVTDQSNYIYVTGGTASDDFPIKNSYIGSSGIYNGGDYDMFITKLANQHLEKVKASSYVGGTGTDVGKSIALDDFGNIYLTGKTDSTNFPKTLASYGPLGYDDVYISIFDKYISKLLVSTTIGGEDDDVGNAITVDHDGGVYLTGTTSSTLFPVSNINGEYKKLNGHDDVFFMFFNRTANQNDPNRGEPVNNLKGRMFSTYLGSNNADYGNAIALDSSYNTYLTGHTWSDGTYEIPFPTTSNAFDTTPNGVDDVFVTKFSVLQDYPSIKYLSPTVNATNVSVYPKILLTFYKTIKAGNKPIELKDAKGNIIPISILIYGNILSITPKVKLSYKTSYFLTLQSGSIKNLAGNVNSYYATSFTTAPYFSIGQINSAASNVKQYIETNYELPSTVIVGNETVNIAQFLHLSVVATYQINNAIGSLIQLKNDTLPSSSIEQMNAGTLTNIEYIDFAQRINDYMNKNQEAPPFGLIGLGQVGYQSQIYLYSRILDYNNKIGTLPNVIAIKSWSMENIPITETMPTVQSVDPVNLATKVPVNKTIKITFKEPIKAGTMWIELKNSNGDLIPITKVISGNILTIYHAVLSKGIKYTLTLYKNSIKSLFGNSIFTYKTQFTTTY